MAGKAVTHTEDWWTRAPTHVIRCTARYETTGLPCRREAAPGASVCNSHGARAPQVVAAAATRIQLSADDAAKRLLAMVEDPAVETREKIKILQDVLDRSGLGAANKVMVGIVGDDPVESLFRSILGDPEGLLTAEQMLAAPQVRTNLAGPRERPESGDEDSIGSPPATEDIVDAELVEDAPAPHSTYEVVDSRIPRHIREAMAELL